MKKIVLVLCLVMLVLGMSACKKDERDNLSDTEKQEAVAKYFTEMTGRVKETLQLYENIAAAFNKINQIYSDCAAGTSSPDTVLYVLDGQGNFWDDPESALKCYEEDIHGELALKKSSLETTYKTLETLMSTTTAPIKDLDEYHTAFKETLAKYEKCVEAHNAGGYNKEFLEKIKGLYSEITSANEELFELHKSEVEKFLGQNK